MATKKQIATPVAEKAQVNINGVAHDIDTLSDTVKSLLVVHNTWQVEREASIKALEDARLAVAKNEAALRDLSAEIVTLIENEKATVAE
jgi:dTDP-4-dehydrorhamnose 3,5-epimerase-like enzyme